MPHLYTPTREEVASHKRQIAHGGGRVVSASGSETRDTSSTLASAVIYDAYTSIIIIKKKKKTPNCHVI